MKMEPFFYTLTPTAFGKIGIIWRQTRPQVLQIRLNRSQQGVEDFIRQIYPDSTRHVSPETARLGGLIQCFLEGDAVVFDMDMLAMETCTAFQRQVLLANAEIDRGSAGTYGGIAKRIGAAGGSRAVGHALAKNPFPIVIPCHRVVRTNGDIGEYQGGSDMKRALLALEGVAFTDTGKVVIR